MAKAEKNEKTNKKQKHFWKDFKAELKKVIWPTRNQVVNSTIIIIAIVLLITGIVFVLDLAFEALNTYGIDKLKVMVQNEVKQENNATVEDENKTNEDENTSTEGENQNNENAENNEENNTNNETENND
ncbi:MAG: preprotein translocase subunit SecE [Clostridia bacterium]|nr:preprotein translocase subunit SecE [Clostridia bacterium]